jgi:periplasmic protein CpxP/Spy
MTMLTRLIYTGLAISFLFTPAAAHSQKNDSSKGIARMAKELGLSEEQKTKMKSILDAEKKKVDAIFAEEKQKLQLVQEDTRSNLKEVLSPGQMDKLDKKMREQNSENGGVPKK